MSCCKNLGLVTITEESDTIPVVDCFPYDCGTYPLLWQRAGLFRLISPSVIINARDLGATWCKTTYPPINYGPFIRWEQGVDVDPKIARTLLGE